MPRAFIAASLGIALQGAGSVALIAWATRAGPPGSAFSIASAVEQRASPAASPSLAATPPPSVAPPAGAPPPGAPPARELAARTVERLTAPFAVTRPPPADAPPAKVDRSLQESTPAPKRRALRSFRLEMRAGLAALQERVARCSAADASFTLDVETVQGGVRIVEAQLAARGSASDVGVACARSALLGELIAAPSAEPGRHWQMPFAAGSTT